MTIKERIEETLEHFDYCIVSKTRVESDNVIRVDSLHKPKQLYIRLILWFGTDRVVKCPGGYKVTSYV